MIQNYIQAVNAKFITGKTTEHSFRGDLQSLLESIIGSDYMVINEPKRQTCGAPDYIIEKNSIPIGFIEAKDIGDTDLEGKKKTGNKEQFDRYKASLNNIVFTNYLDFYFYQESELVAQVSIAEISENQIKALPENFSMFESLIQNFSIYVGNTIRSSQKLAKMMASKAKLLAEILEKAVTSDEDNHEDSTLKGHFEGFKQILIHDITPKGFADVYAQTIAYGMFAARLYDSTLPTFSRQEAAELIPKSNPFLRKLFGYIAGPDIDDRIKWIVDSLADIFLHCNVQEILKTYGRSTRMNNPIIHFYETFLSEYDAKLRKARGVWYTPEPVVDFIVRAVDEVLKTDFGLASGLADTAKTTIKIKNPTTDKRYKDGYITTDKEVHKVQILDPATGTGTFLSHVIKHIYQDFEGMQGIWSNYVEKDLIPRLNGFELLMASYAMAHLQLNLLLSETGYKPQGNKEQRLKVYLTNSLEESHPDTGTLFANWLSAEANSANEIKRDTPVMCIIGNPPYSVSSSNKGQWILDLIADYKKNLNEKKINLDDDYIKFIRYGQHFIDKNGEGILAYISNNSFIDGVTHRQMRQELLKSFDKIYIIDLHGSAKKKEASPDGSIDQNVFDIMQGVSINIFIKTNKNNSKKLGKVYHHDLYGSRSEKYEYLSNKSLNTINFNEIHPKQPYYFFVPKDLDSAQYQSWVSLTEIFNIVNNGIQTDRDPLFIDKSKSNLEHKFRILLGGNLCPDFIKKYRIVDSSSFKITERIKNKVFSSNYIKQVLYRPFDVQYIYYDTEIVSRPAHKVMSHMLNENLALLCCRQQSTFDFQHVFLTKLLSERCSVSSQTKETNFAFPLYLYPAANQINLDHEVIRKSNLNLEIINKIEQNIGLTFTDEKEDINGTFAPLDILDYVYAVLYSPKYRETYKEYLKIDFPKIPLPKTTKVFIELIKLGGQLRMLHLMEDSRLKMISQYPENGDNIVEKHVYKDGNVYINDEQYFANVHEVAWNFYIGGYQPAQKWLKDRKGQALQFEDIKHYQKIIATLQKTSEIMEEIDQIDFM